MTDANPDGLGSLKDLHRTSGDKQLSGSIDEASYRLNPIASINCERLQNGATIEFLILAISTKLPRTEGLILFDELRCRFNDDALVIPPSLDVGARLNQNRIR